MYRTINTYSDAITLQQYINKLEQWENTWQMKFNADKCFTIRITNSRHPIRVDYKIHDQHLNLVPDSKYLGVSLDQTLSWKTHINNVTAKAYRTLGFLRRNTTGCTKIVKDRTYKARIRPQLEYASPVWDPHTQNLSHQLESVQRRAAGYVCSDFHSRTPGCVTDMLRSLEWESLQTRRKYARLILFYKIFNYLIDIPINEYITKYNSCTRGKHKYVQPYANKDSYQLSFFPRSVVDWNHLPASLSR